ncbi:MAG: hypothetical protein WCX93_13835 [Burkholderiaceae bacterium]
MDASLFWIPCFYAGTILALAQSRDELHVLSKGGFQMSYGQIVSALTRSLDARIIGYDNLPDHGGCILYGVGRVKRIDVTAQALECGTQELAAFLRQTIDDSSVEGSSLRVGMREGRLAVL